MVWLWLWLKSKLREIVRHYVRLKIWPTVHIRDEIASMKKSYSAKAKACSARLVENTMLVRTKLVRKKGSVWRSEQRRWGAMCGGLNRADGASSPKGQGKKEKKKIWKGSYW
ncbi:hypothetical protein POTOM_003098 [Populus tomentosa]|uniref:Uncharacterized protein n=1 Tax=Populus tomentosa TaxID=118781 RepID=A0A8X8DKX1_POPTO|nr:hypothetical protein POTOM_003098 [Populus tomentosa]